MTDNLIELLESLNYPVYRQGSFTEDEPYPDSFFTYWNQDSPDHAHYDNQSYGTSWDYIVFFYSTDPDLTYSVMDEARALLKENGWVVPSKGADVNSDQPTHTGRSMEVYYLET